MSTEIYQDGKGEWRWKRTNDDGDTVGSATEGYSSKSSAEANANRQQADSDKTEAYTDQGGKHRWRVTAQNGNIVAASHKGFDSADDAAANAKLNGYDLG